MSDTIVAGGRSPANDFDGALTALEERADIASLEGLQHERRQMLPEYAALKALHAGNSQSKWDAKRKALLEGLKIRHRKAAMDRGEKVTEAYVDALAHGDEQYLAFIDQGIAGHVRYVELDTRITEIEEQVRNREYSMTAYSKEISLR